MKVYFLVMNSKRCNLIRFATWLWSQNVKSDQVFTICSSWLHFLGWLWSHFLVLKKLLPWIWWCSLNMIEKFDVHSCTISLSISDYLLLNTLWHEILWVSIFGGVCEVFSIRKNRFSHYLRTPQNTKAWKYATLSQMKTSPFQMNEISICFLRIPKPLEDWSTHQPKVKR